MNIVIIVCLQYTRLSNSQTSNSSSKSLKRKHTQSKYSEKEVEAAKALLLLSKHVRIGEYENKKFQKSPKEHSMHTKTYGSRYYIDKRKLNTKGVSLLKKPMYNINDPKLDHSYCQISSLDKDKEHTVGVHKDQFQQNNNTVINTPVQQFNIKNKQENNINTEDYCITKIIDAIEQIRQIINNQMLCKEAYEKKTGSYKLYLYESKTIVKLFFKYYCNIEIDNSFFSKKLDIKRYSYVLRLYVEKNKAYLKSIYKVNNSIDTDYLSRVLDNVFFDIIYDKDKYSDLYIYKYMLRLQRRIEKNQINSLFLQYYAIKLIEKITNKFDKLILISQLLFLIRSEIVNDNDLKLKRFIVFLKIYYSRTTISELNPNFNKQMIDDFLHCFTKGKRFYKVLKNLTGINIDTQDKLNIYADTLESTLKVVFGLMIPYYFLDIHISSNLDNMLETQDILTQNICLLLKYGIQLNSEVLRSIPDSQ